MDGPKALSTTSSADRKRKRASPAYYAVRAGHAPGVYLSWDDVKAQIKGFSNADHRKFSSLADAETWYNAKGTAVAASPRPKSAHAKYYAVRAGHVPGVYTDWEQVKKVTKGFPKAKHKSFPTEEQAWAFVRATTESSSLAGSAAASTKAESERPAKRPKQDSGAAAVLPINGQSEPGTGPLPADAEDGFDRTIRFDPATNSIVPKTELELNARKLQPTGDISGPLIVYTDGSSLGNGQIGAVGGVGVFFGPNDPRNVSEPLMHGKQTNQRAELSAIQRAVDIAPIDKDVHIYSDSNYAIKCVTEWFIKWRTNGWKNSAGKDVENRDIIKPIIQRIDERKLARANTKFTWVKGHANMPGNMAADALAVNGARQAQEALLYGAGAS